MEDTKRNSIKREASWDWEDYLKEIGWFASKCKLPDQGLIPSEISSNLVSPTILQECFGKKSDSGYKLSNCKTIPHSEIKQLQLVLDGHQSPLQKFLSITLAKGLYAHRILNLKVNWAAYAHTKHKNQLQYAWRKGRPAPDGPPLLRHAVRYESPPPLKANAKHSQRAGPVGPQFSPFTSAGANTDNTRRCSKKRVFPERKAPIPTPSGIGCKLEPTGSNHVGNVSNGVPAKKPLRSVLTPDAIKLEISRMVRLGKRVHDALSMWEGILDLVSKQDFTDLAGMGAVYEEVAEEAEQYFSTVNSWKGNNCGAPNRYKGEVGPNPTGNVRNGVPAKKPLVSILTPDAIKLEISRMVRLGKRVHDALSMWRGILDLVSKQDFTDLTGVDDAYEEVAEEAEQYFSTVNSWKENNCGAQNRHKEEVAHEEVVGADLGGTSARTHDKYKTWIRKGGVKPVVGGKQRGCGIHPSPSAAHLVENLFPGGKGTSCSSPLTAKDSDRKENFVQTGSTTDVNKPRNISSPTIDATCPQYWTRLQRKNKSPPVPDVPLQRKRNKI